MLLILFSDTDHWPASESIVNDAVAEERQIRAMEGWSVRGEEDGWSRREYILATEARIPVIQGTAFTFELGVQKVAELLWKPSELLWKLGLPCCACRTMVA